MICKQNIDYCYNNYFLRLFKCVVIFTNNHTFVFSVVLIFKNYCELGNTFKITCINVFREYLNLC